MAPRSLRMAAIAGGLALNGPDMANAQSPPPPPPASAPAPCCLSEGLHIAERYRVDAIQVRRFTHADFWNALDPWLGSQEVATQDVGTSLLGRAIRSVTFGSGAIRVLLWSQMHGDESTATMALADVIRFFAEAQDDPLRERIRKGLTIIMVPMLNPDGAEIFQRENAIGVDVNRDARRLATPEGQTLKGLRDEFEPAFGFNLHDQGVRRVAGEGGLQVAIALLAPAADEAKSYGPVRSKARLLAARIAEVLAHEVPGRLAKWDDSFEPRAFGDLMQQWGTSTVLIESGGLPNDPEKQRIRALNIVALLTAFDAMVTGRIDETDPAIYNGLPFNLSVDHDLHLTGGRIVLGAASIPADIALVYDDPTAGRVLRVDKVGDLGQAAALDTLEISGMFVHPSAHSAESDGQPATLPVLREAHLADFTVRRGVDPESPVVYRFARGSRE